MKTKVEIELCASKNAYVAGILGEIAQRFHLGLITTEQNMRVEGKDWSVEVTQLPEDKTLAALGNLLAVIHRDGGHYTAEHGVEKACKDAERTVNELRREIDSMREQKRQVNSLEKRND